MKNHAMRNTILALACILIPGGQTNAQTWCPPGAEWTFSYFTVDWGTGETAEGFTKNQYIGDTLLDGQLAQIIRGQRIYQVNGAGEWISSGYGHLYTRYSDDVVYQRNAATLQFDTLLCYGLAPGGHWTLFGSDPSWQFTVLDTATEEVDGVPLRRSIIQLAGGTGLVFVDTLLERIGFTAWHTFGPGVILVDGTFQSFQCYRDTDLSFPDPGPEDCGFTAAMEEQATSMGVMVFPNPGSDHLKLDPHGIQGQFYLFDARGARMHVAAINGVPTQVNTSALPTGPYYYRMQDPMGRLVAKGIWLKQ
jgi:hypothetical protein